MMDNPHKRRRGFNRLWHAAIYSLQGLRAAWQEGAFRMEVALAVLMVPAAFWLGQSWAESVLLISGVCAVIVAELLNTAVESVVDQVSPDWHALAKRAKDLGSAAVFIAMLYCLGVWLSLIWLHYESLL